jgi:hypothetical protein
MTDEFTEEGYEPEPWDGQSEPQPSQFGDYDNFIRAMVDFKVSRISPITPGAIQNEVAAGVRQGLQPPPDVPYTLPDDEYREDRKRLLADLKEAAMKEAEAKAQGDKKNEELWHDQFRWAKKEMDALPKSKAEIQMEEAVDEFDRGAVSLLTNPEWKNRPEWKTEKWKHDASIKVRDVNRKAKNEILLPREYSPYGDIAPTTPANMLRFSLPEKVIAEFKQQVYDGSKSLEPGEVFRRSYLFLHKNGWASGGQFAHDMKDRTEGKGKRPEEMNQKEFEEWMSKKEKPRRIRILPRPQAR